MIARPAFQRWASGFWPTRWIARRQAGELFRITTGFVHSQVLKACVELGVLDDLKAEPRTTEEVAARTGLSNDSAGRLLDSAAALRLVCRTSTGNWTLDDLGAVVAANSGIQAMIRHHAMLYRDLDDPVALLNDTTTETETSRFWAYARNDQVTSDQASAYSDLMAASQDLVAAEVTRSYDFSKHDIVLDIGGGNGTFLISVAEQFTGARLWLFDLPEVAKLAQNRLDGAGHSDRTTCHGGDFFNDEIPTGADCLTLVRVLCDHGDDAALALLEAVRRAMRPGDCLLVAEPLAGQDADGRALAAYFDMYFLAMRSGRCRTPDQIGYLLHKAGFASWSALRTRMSLFTGLIVAHT